MMAKCLSTFLVVGAAVLLESLSLFAHHGTGMYDPQHPVTLEGIVTEFEFVNPHARIHIEVKDKKGSVEQWIVECSAPAKLYRSGWTAKTLKPGDRITATGFARKDGTKEMAMTKIVPQNGPVLGGDID